VSRVQKKNEKVAEKNGKAEADYRGKERKKLKRGKAK